MRWSSVQPNYAMSFFRIMISFIKNLYKNRLFRQVLSSTLLFNSHNFCSQICSTTSFKNME